MIHSMLSTSDNPFNPFDQFQEWYAYDTRLGYHSSSFLARLTFPTDELSELDYWREIEQAIDEIVEENVLGVSIKVSREFADEDLAVQ